LTFFYDCWEMNVISPLQNCPKIAH
jgi:hypothetical protein